MVECKAATYTLKAYSGMEYGKFEATYLRDVPEAVYNEFKTMLPENWRKRIMLKTDGIYGGRFSGAGFNGCCMAIVDPEKTESIREFITTEYAKLFPEYMADFTIEFCDTADGAEV